MQQLQVSQLYRSGLSTPRIHPVHQSTTRLVRLPSTSTCPAALPVHLSLGIRSSCSRPMGTTTVTQAGGQQAAQMVLEKQPMLSDIITANTCPWETIAWKAMLDILLPVACLVALYRLIEWSGERARLAIQSRLEGDSDMGVQLRRRSTVAALVLLALRNPAAFVLPPLCFAYVFRTALNIVDLVVNKYKPAMPEVAGFMIKQVSAQLVPLDAALQTLLKVTGVLFSAWFFIQLKDILVKDLILVEAIRSGRKELERIYTPLSSLVTWAAVLACGMSVCAAVGISLEPLLAVGGAGGIAAGFASQQVLTNIVSGINIFLTRPFVVGDQVRFTGGTDLEGTIEAVEIVRTILRTTGGTLVAIPNKLVAELIVFNRTRSLAAAAAAEEAVAATTVAAAAPLRWVLCFTVELGRELEAQLRAVKADIKEYLNATTKQQLVDAGLAVASKSSYQDDEAAAALVAAAAGAPADSSEQQHSGHSAAAQQQGEQEQVLDAGPASVSVSEALSSLVAAATGSDAKASSSLEAAQRSSDDAEKEPQLPEAEPLPVSITMSQLEKDSIVLFVRCELLLPPAAKPTQDAVEQQTEDVLMGLSALIKRNYQGVVLWR